MCRMVAGKKAGGESRRGGGATSIHSNSSSSSGSSNTTAAAAAAANVDNDRGIELTMGRDLAAVAARGEEDGCRMAAAAATPRR